ncbi:MAG: kinase/pyrophosphorylase [Rhodobacterales bacterium]|nr:kinase/pyrophosphorylase [Rhodobacterales bacterium]
MRMPKPIFVLSDGTGDTAEKVVRAGLQQFEGHLVHVRTHGHVTQPEQLRKWFHLAVRQDALVVTTLVEKSMRKAAKLLSKEHGVRHIDLIGHLLGKLEGFLDEKAVGVPGLMYQANDRYFRRIEAVEYTVKADDGKEPRMILEADIVLVGVSRTSKTPLSTYLAHKGFKVANVPLVLDHPIPPLLHQVEAERVFGLVIDPDVLQTIRQSRLRTMGMGKINYDDLDYILAELEYAEELFRANPIWPVIDVTNKAIEETAAAILGVMQERGLVGPVGEVSQLRS